MSGELADEVERHLSWLRAIRHALLVPHVAVDDRRHRTAAANLERAIDAAERLHQRLATEAAEPQLPW